MAVKVGSARSDEHGKAHGGAAGDQKSGKEVSTQDWYLHSKGWRVVRAKSAAAAEKIAAAMQAACDSPRIGYDQYQRDTLLKQVATLSPAFWPGAVKTPTETDCSALVRVCTAYAFGKDVIGEVLNGARFSTANQVKYMLKTGLFEEMVGDKYTTQSAYLRRGDVLVTKTQAHTVVVLSNGSKAGVAPAETQAAANVTAAGDPLLKRGSKGAAVKELQQLLIAAGYGLPKYGADGDYGAETEAAVRAFQITKGLEVDGICGPKTWAAVRAAGTPGKRIRITGGVVNVRKGAGTSFNIVTTVRKDSEHSVCGQADVNGVTWYHITDLGWISGNYAREV